METEYTIKVCDDIVIVNIEGTIKIQEAFDILIFFQQQGFTTLENCGQNTTLYLKKRDFEEKKRRKTLNDHLDEKKDETLYKEITQENEKLSKKIKSLENTIKNFFDKQNKNTIQDSDLYEAAIRNNEIRLEENSEVKKIKYNTLNQNVTDFHINQRVKVIVSIKNKQLFNGDTGYISKIDHVLGKYSICVVFDTKKILPYSFNYFWFDAEDLCDEKKALEIENGE